MVKPMKITITMAIDTKPPVIVLYSFYLSNLSMLEVLKKSFIDTSRFRVSLKVIFIEEIIKVIERYKNLWLTKKNNE